MATNFTTNVISTKGGFKPSAADMPLDIRIRIESLDDVSSIPMPYVGMIFYVRENGKRYEVLSLKDKKAGMSTLKNALVDEYRELLVSYNDLTDKPEIPSIEGLATEEFVQQQINAIPEVDLEPFATKDEVEQGLEEKVDKVEGKSLMDDAEMARLASVFNANYQFSVNMIDYGMEPSVEYSGEFPNIVVTFNIPVCYPAKPVIEGRMWYGWIPYDESGLVGVSQPSEIHEGLDMKSIQFGLDNGSLIEADPESKENPILIQGVQDCGWLCIIVPQDSGLKGYVDDGVGNAILFTEMDTVSGLAVDDLNITNPINSVKYKVSGLYVANGGGDYTIYIKE